VLGSKRRPVGGFGGTGQEQTGSNRQGDAMHHVDDPVIGQIAFLRSGRLYNQPGAGAIDLYTTLVRRRFPVFRTT
jgi:hypothetical protein